MATQQAKRLRLQRRSQQPKSVQARIDQLKRFAKDLLQSWKHFSSDPKNFHDTTAKRRLIVTADSYRLLLRGIEEALSRQQTEVNDVKALLQEINNG